MMFIIEIAIALFIAIYILPIVLTIFLYLIYCAIGGILEMSRIFSKYLNHGVWK